MPRPKCTRPKTSLREINESLEAKGERTEGTMEEDRTEGSMEEDRTEGMIMKEGRRSRGVGIECKVRDYRDK